MSNAPSSVPTRAAPLALWRVAEAFLRVFFNLFGEPKDIAFQHTHTTRQRALMLPWLRAGEALLRRLLLIEAAGLPKANTPPPRAKRVRVRKRRIFMLTPDKPEEWRVSFRTFASARADGYGAFGAARRKEPKRFHDAWPLAERVEAMLRVFNEPLPYAKRLARQLHASPRRAGALLRLPPERERKAGDIAHLPDLIGREDFEKLGAAARAAFNSS
ncbi:MAG TPA: hypothetical protein VG841_06325 [Caulobacterales bacterium]|nr:hypothetical protein [Caulobacterales bacterium]